MGSPSTIEVLLFETFPKHHYSLGNWQNDQAGLYALGPIPVGGELKIWPLCASRMARKFSRKKTMRALIRSPKKSSIRSGKG